MSHAVLVSRVLQIIQHQLLFEQTGTAYLCFQVATSVQDCELAFAPHTARIACRALGLSCSR